MSWEDGGALEPEDEPEIECPDCRGECSLVVVDYPPGKWGQGQSNNRQIPCHRCESTGQIRGEDAAEVLQEQAETAAERRAEEARDR